MGNQLSVEAKQVIVDGLNKCEQLEAWLGVLNILNAAPKETGGVQVAGVVLHSLQTVVSYAVYTRSRVGQRV